MASRSFWTALIFEQDGDLNLTTVFLGIVIVAAVVVALIRSSAPPWVMGGLVAIITALIAGSTIYNKTKIVKGDDGHAH
jgi:uncharacterized membrane protein